MLRPYPKRDSAWAMLERAPVKSDGSISSSHWLSGSPQAALAIEDLQVQVLISCLVPLDRISEEHHIIIVLLLLLKIVTICCRRRRWHHLHSRQCSQRSSLPRRSAAQSPQCIKWPGKHANQWRATLCRQQPRTQQALYSGHLRVPLTSIGPSCKYQRV